MPETDKQLKEYYDNNLPGTWQHRRGMKDFLSVMRTTKKFADRFDRNLGQL